MADPLTTVKRATARRSEADASWRAAIREARAEGASLREIAAAAGVSHVRILAIVRRGQTNWVGNYQLDPGVYYVHVAGLDEPCFYAGDCPVREFSQIITLVIAAPPPPPPRPPPPPPTPAPSALVRCVVPKVVGQSLAAAKARIRKAHCSVGKVSRMRSSKRLRNRVVRTSPRPKTQLRSGAHVSLVVGLGPRR
jgi:hypothetical protein